MHYIVATELSNVLESLSAVVGGNKSVQKVSSLSCLT